MQSQTSNSEIWSVEKPDTEKRKYIKVWTHDSCLFSGQKSCRGGERKERMGRHVASSGRPSSCIDFQDRRVNSEHPDEKMRWKEKRKRGLRTKVWHFREKEMHREDEISIWADRCVMKEEKMAGNDREQEWGGEKGCWPRTKDLEVMDGLSRLARLSVRRAEVVKRNVEINTLHRNLNQEECWKCGKREKVCALVNLVWAEFWKSGEPQQDACSIYSMNQTPLGRHLHKDTLSSPNNCAA